MRSLGFGLGQSQIRSRRWSGAVAFFEAQLAATGTGQHHKLTRVIALVHSLEAVFNAEVVPPERAKLLAHHFMMKGEGLVDHVDSAEHVVLSQSSLDAEARAANDIASAWGNATDALTKHLDLVAQGRETWADVWTGIAETAERALIDIAMTEGKVELGRALGALAVGNFAGAGLHLAAGAALLAIGGTASYLTGGAGDADRAAEKEAKKTSSRTTRERVPTMGGSSEQGAPVTISVNFGGASFYGSGGPRQAASELVDLLNRHGHLSGATLDPRLMGMR